MISVRLHIYQVTRRGSPLAGAVFCIHKTATGHAAQRAGELPGYHGDLFDRMLIAQSQMEALILLSPHNLFKQYGILLMNTKI